MTNTYAGIFFPCCALATLSLAVSACGKPGTQSSSSGASRAPSASPSAPAPSGSVPPGEARPKTVLALSSSAYHASIEADEQGFLLLTATAAHRLVPGRPPTETSLDLAYGATTMRDSVVYWSGGSILAAPKSGGTPRPLGRLPERPQSFVSSGDDFAWLEKTKDGRFSILTINGEKPRVAYAATGTIEALTMLSDWVFFVERLTDGSWRIGGVRGAGTPTFSASHGGRAPAMLVGWHDLYYYDGNTRDVRRLSPDLQREETLAKDFICSPMAVWEHVYCAQVEGLFELRAGANPRRLAATNLGAPITDLAVNARHVAFVSDAGADKLVVKVLSR